MFDPAGCPVTPPKHAPFVLPHNERFNASWHAPVIDAAHSPVPNKKQNFAASLATQSCTPNLCRRTGARTQSYEATAKCNLLLRVLSSASDPAGGNEG